MSNLDYLKITIVPAGYHGLRTVDIKTSMNGRPYTFSQPLAAQSPTESELDYYFRLAKHTLGDMLEKAAANEALDHTVNINDPLPAPADLIKKEQ